MPIIRTTKPNPRFDSIDSVLFDLKNSLLRKAMNFSNQTLLNLCWIVKNAYKNANELNSFATNCH